MRHHRRRDLVSGPGQGVLLSRPAAELLRRAGVGLCTLANNHALAVIRKILEHLKMQGTLQPHGDNAISKTIEAVGWEHFEHGADIGVRGFGPDPATAFEQAALAMTAVITDPALVEAETAVEIRCRAPDHELLLADWLNALIYEMATRGMLFARFRVRIDADGLHGLAWGERTDVARHQPAVEVKGATYTALRVARDNGHWVAQCVIDV